MDLREQLEVTLPVTGKKVVLRGYITGRMKQAIEQVLLGDAEIGERPSFKGGAALAARNKALELIVMSVDGKSGDVLNAVLDLPEQDYDFVRAEVDKIQSPLALPTKTASTTITTTPSATTPASAGPGGNLTPSSPS